MKIVNWIGITYLLLVLPLSLGGFMAYGHGLGDMGMIIILFIILLFTIQSLTAKALNIH